MTNNIKSDSDLFLLVEHVNEEAKALIFELESLIEQKTITDKQQISSIQKLDSSIFFLSRYSCDLVSAFYDQTYIEDPEMSTVNKELQELFPDIFDEKIKRGVEFEKVVELLVREYEKIQELMCSITTSII